MGFSQNGERPLWSGALTVHFFFHFYTAERKIDGGGGGWTAKSFIRRYCREKTIRPFGYRNFKRFSNVTVDSRSTFVVSTFNESSKPPVRFPGTVCYYCLTADGLWKYAFGVRKRRIEIVFPLTSICLHFQLQNCFQNYWFNINVEYSFRQATGE